MMNDELNRLKEENNNLKQENETLKSSLEVYKLVSSISNSLEDYYTDKYLVEYNKILNKRLSEVNDHLEELKNEYNDLSLQLTSFSSQLKSNQEYAALYEKLNKMIDDNNLILKQQTEEYDKGHKVYLDKQQVLKDATLGYYSTIVKSMEPLVDPALVMTNVEFVMGQLKATLYSLILECRNLNFQDMKNLRKLEELETKIVNENKNIEEEKNQIADKVKSKSKEEITSLQQDLQKEIVLNEKLYAELKETFEKVMKKDIKDIVEQVKYNKMVEKSSKEITCIIEQTLKEKLTSLESQDTLTNLLMYKQLELKKLLEEKTYLSKKAKRYDSLKKEENDLYTNYLEASKNIDMLMDFIDSAALSIAENDAYKTCVDRYEYLKKEEINAQDEYNKIIAEDKKIEANRIDYMHVGYSEDEIKKYTEKLNRNNVIKNQLAGQLRQIRDEIREIESNPSNLKLMAVLREKEFAEAHLPTLYNFLRSLKVKVEQEKDELKSLEESLKDYDKIINRILVLQDEINNSQ